jgi:hypothetical protein
MTTMTNDHSYPRVSWRLESMYTLQENEPDQHAVHVTPGVSRTTTICKVSTKSKSVPCSRDEVLAPNDTRSNRLSSVSFPLQQTTLKQGVRFGEVVTRLLGFKAP